MMWAWSCYDSTHCWYPSVQVVGGSDGKTATFPLMNLPVFSLCDISFQRHYKQPHVDHTVVWSCKVASLGWIVGHLFWTASDQRVPLLRCRLTLSHRRRPAFDGSVSHSASVNFTQTKRRFGETLWERIVTLTLFCSLYCSGCLSFDILLISWNVVEKGT